MRSGIRRRVLVAAGTCSAVLVAGIAVRVAAWPAASPQGLVSTPRAPAATAQLASPDPAAARADSLPRAPVQAPEELIEGSDASLSQDPRAGLAHVRDELRTTLEASLYNSLDPAAILDAALSLGSLEVDPRAYSEPDPSGSIVYPLLGVPEGTRAELWVGRSSKPEVARVLSLRIELDPTALPYAFEGYARSKAIAQVQMQLDKDGNALNLTILTDLPPSSRNRDLGVTIDTASFSQGLLCYFDAKDPASWRARAHGLDAGKPRSWPTDAVTVAGRWPAPEKLDAFCGLLQSKYETVHH